MPDGETNHRDACDDCHRRKVRCIAYNGACENCVYSSKSCTFSPRTRTGRPKKHKSQVVSARSKAQSIGRSNTEKDTTPGGIPSLQHYSSVSTNSSSDGGSTQDLLAPGFERDSPILIDGTAELNLTPFETNIHEEVSRELGLQPMLRPYYQDTSCQSSLLAPQPGIDTDVLSSILFNLSTHYNIITNNPSLNDIAASLCTVLEQLDLFCDTAGVYVYHSTRSHVPGGSEQATVPQRLTMMIVSMSCETYSMMVNSELFGPLYSLQDGWNMTEVEPVWLSNILSLRTTSTYLRNVVPAQSMHTAERNVALVLTQISLHLNFCQRVSVTLSSMNGFGAMPIEREARRLFPKIQHLQNVVKALAFK